VSQNSQQPPLFYPRPGIEKGNLKERSVRSGAITITEQILGHGFQIVSVMILSRLLTPEDYGIVAMVTAITGFVNLFRELGLSSATVQSQKITQDQISSLFWINAGLGLLITVIIAAMGPFLALFYKKPQLALVAVGISFTSFFSSLGTQHAALLSRQMRFGTMAIIRVSAILVGLLTAVVVALSGGTYWALVWSSVVTSLWATGGFWLASGFRPGRFKRKTGVRPMVRFGANIAGFDLVNYFHRNMDNILIGRFWGAAQLGLYSKAYALLMLPMSNLRYPLSRVAFPVLSRLQNDPAKFRDYFLKYCSLLSFITMPLVAFLYACSGHIIRVLLGPRWVGAAELFSILALVAFIQPPAQLRSTVLSALGRGGRLFKWGLYNAIATVASFFCGIPWGAKGVAIAYCIATYAILHPTLTYAFRDTPIRPADFYKCLIRPSSASIIMCLIALWTVGLLHHASDLLIIAIVLPLSLIAYLGIFWLMPGGKGELHGYWDYASILRRSVSSLWLRMWKRASARPSK
jgi:PST family polysaccharide transporter